MPLRYAHIAEAAAKLACKPRKPCAVSHSGGKRHDTLIAARELRKRVSKCVGPSSFGSAALLGRDTMETHGVLLGRLMALALFSYNMQKHWPRLALRSGKRR